MDLLLSSDSHPAIVRYFDRARDGAFVYLALELCACTLNDLVGSLAAAAARDAAAGIWTGGMRPAERGAEEDGARGKEPSVAHGFRMQEGKMREALGDLVSGVAFLHKLGIVHRDLKPLNILVTDGGHLKISDMGLSKRLEGEQSSFETLGGTFGWRSPEQILGQRSTKSVDLFAVGCILFFTCTLGVHPFGARANREANILSAQPDLSKLKEDATACHLIRALLHHDPSVRPQAPEARQHPFFWSAMLQLDFVLDVSDRLESLPPDAPLVQDLEARSAAVFGVGDGVAGDVRGGASSRGGTGAARGDGGPTWDGALSKDLLLDLGAGGSGRRKYKYDSFRDLLRAIRNKKNHFLDLPSLLKWSWALCLTVLHACVLTHSGACTAFILTLHVRQHPYCSVLGPPHDVITLTATRENLYEV